MQSLILALQFIGGELQRRQKELRITWLGEENLGFPRMKLQL